MYSNRACFQKIPLFYGIIPVYFVIFEVTFTVIKYILLNSNSTNLIKAISLILFAPLSIMTIITHLKSMFTNPGYVPIPYKSSDNNLIVSNNYSNNNNENDLLGDRSDLFCKKCNNNRPLRSHHCKICGKCTLKMDHHCDWIANCVGYYNQKNFYQFLFYSTTGDAVAFILIMLRISNCEFSIKAYNVNNEKINSVFQLIYLLWEPIQLVIGALCSLAMTIGIGFLFRKQTDMLLNNQTTIDKKLFEKWENSPYYEEDKSKNFNSVMGNSVCEWFSLTFNGKDGFNLGRKSKYYNLENMES